MLESQPKPVEHSNVKKVSYSELLSHVSSKAELYNALAIKGKSRLVSSSNLV